jgi:tetratricopeptide (TPR) repeat protein
LERIHQSELDEAESLCKSVLNSQPDHPEALFRLGQIAKSRGEHASAIRLFESVLTIDPKNIRVCVELAQEYAALSEPDKAETLLRAGLEDSPSYAPALIWLGYIARGRGDHVSAATHFENVLRSDPGHPGAHLELATEYMSLSRLEEADTLCRLLLNEMPQHVPGLLCLGRISRRRGNREHAAECFRRALAVDPTRNTARVELAQIRIELSQFQEAEELLRSVLSGSPANVPALMWLGYMYRHRGDHRAAAAQFQAVLGADSRHCGARLDLAQELAEQGLLDDARTLISSVLTEAPATAAALMRLGYLARREGDRERAAEHFSAAAAAARGEAGPIVELSIELRELGRLNEARSVITSLLKTRADDEWGLIQLGNIERGAGNHAEALRIHKSVVELHRSSAQGWVELALTHRLLGSPDRSEEDLRRALEISPNFLAALQQLAEHALFAENAGKCLAICERAMAAHPGALGPCLTASKALMTLEGTNAALRFLESVSAKFGDSPELLVRTLEILQRSGRFDEMGQLIADATERIQRNSWVRMRSIELEIAIGRFARARAGLRRLSTPVLREAAHAEILRGLLAEAEWRLPDALGHYRAALKLSPDNALCHHELTRACILNFELAEAAEHLRTSIRLNASAKILRRESLNTSQSHFGHLLDECALDGALCSELKTLQGCPPETRVQRLVELVQENPDHTPTAMSLVLALRQAGQLPGRHQSRSSMSGYIPRSIAQYWSTPDLPDDVADMMRTWSRFNTLYAVHRFDQESAAAFIAQTCPSEVLRAYELAELPAQKADIFRLAWLFAEGGTYVDADDRCLGSLTAVHPPGARLMVYQEDLGTLGNNFIASTMWHPVIGRALSLATTAMNRGDTDLIWLSTGPGLLTRAFAQVWAETGGELKHSLVVLDRRDVASVTAMHCHAAYKTTNRHWIRSAFNRSGRSGAVQPQLTTVLRGRTGEMASSSSV